MSVTREQFVAELRTWLGTPFKIQGRLKGVGVDCVGLLICSAHNLGLTDFDQTDYRRPRFEMLRDGCDANMQQIMLDTAGPGDVLLFRWGSHATHLMVLTSTDTVIHALATTGRVVETSLDPRAITYLDAVYHVKGIA
ncbi:NlpC/P60 family protein [Paraburkholderia mimosarum]|uniref:NlpC/P60 family protein n=1 Tax=Paraburkholderia mimosarum TaxID=312026 RepID=UPI0039C2F653